MADFFSLIDGNRRIASCLHADTLDEVTDILCSAPLGVSRSALGRVSVVLFMHVARGPVVIGGAWPRSGKQTARASTISGSG